MSQQGYLGWYSTDRRRTPAEIVAAVSRITTVESFAWAYRTNGPDNSWNEAVGFDPAEVPGALITDSVVIYSAGDSGGTEATSLGDDVSAEEFIRACGEDHCVYADIKSSMYRDIDADHQSIPEGLRGDFRADCLALRVGWHDLFESHDELRFIARAWFSISIWGHGVPQGGDDYTRAFYELPFVQRMQRSLEADLGSLSRYRLWHV
ncbi:MAG: hypothetical protein L6Q35_09850 [Phycisphaerales bacterium]|nr:hypothetical protein [Phycisphaerales bacterium]